jgi:hypothetical protein
MYDNYLQGMIYHMVSVKNLVSILNRQALISKEKLNKENLAYTSIAIDTVQSLRDRVFVWDNLAQQYYSLHRYVPFYFATHTPMLYWQFKDGIQNSIVIFEVSRTIFTTPGVLFTDGNASMQQLSKFSGERVGIIPASSQNMVCHRVYRPRGPLGTNEDISDIYSDITLLDRLNWNIINDRDFSTPENKRIKHAEVLVPDILPLEHIERVAVSTLDMEQQISVLLAQYGYTIPVVYKPELFFH